MTRRQLLALYFESFALEANEQIRLTTSMFFAHPKVDKKDFLKGLQYQANPPSFEDAKQLGTKGFEDAFRKFGKEVTNEGVGDIINAR